MHTIQRNEADTSGRLYEIVSHDGETITVHWWGGKPQADQMLGDWQPGAPVERTNEKHGWRISQNSTTED